MKLILDGKVFAKADFSAAKKIMAYLDSLPYGKAVTKETIAQHCNYKNTNNVQLSMRMNDKDKLESYRYRYSYRLMLWANPKTIRDLKNGKFKL